MAKDFLQGQVLTSTRMGVTKTYIFPNNLPGGGMMCDGYYGCSPTPSPTANSRVLIGTAGFAALNLVAPNYVIPNGFLPTDGGTLNYAFVDQVTFASLPTDGANALSRSGMIIPNLATNFAGYSGSVTAAAAVNYQGLWFNPSESGWGINFAHDGDTIFASWFTYDLTGKGTWLVMAATKTGPNTYTGSLIQGTGPAFDAVPFPPLGSPGGATVSGLGGTGTLTFTDANNALFSYTVNGITQTKAITRQLFGPQPTCTFGAQPNLAMATNYTALWWAAPRGLGSGLGHQPDPPGRSDLRDVVYVRRRPHADVAGRNGEQDRAGRVHGDAARPADRTSVQRDAVSAARHAWRPGRGDRRLGDIHVHRWQYGGVRLHRRRRLADQDHHPSGASEPRHRVPVSGRAGAAAGRETFASKAVAMRRAALALAFAVVGNAAFAAGIGDPAPAFALRDARGDIVSLESLRGQVVYVDFWASWCGPCRRSFPWMNEMQRRYGGQGLAIVAINVDKNPADAARFLERNPAQFAVAYDRAGATPLAYAVRDMPSSYLIDSRGKVVEVEHGFRDERKDALERRIQALLAAR